MTHMPPTITTRDGLREAIRFDLDEKLEAALQPVTLDDGDVWNGIRVVTKKDLDEAIAAIFDEPLPPTSETVAEVSTPATIEVSAECPRCFIATTIEMSITPELRVNTDGSSIHLRGKAKAKTHVCGQLELPEAKRPTVVDGQEGMDLEDVVTDDLEGDQAIADITVAGEALIEAVDPSQTADLANGATSDEPVCDWPGCTRHAFHRGKHIPAPAADDGDTDLLPA